MIQVLGVDPGSEKSAFVYWTGKEILAKGLHDNEDLLCVLAAIQWEAKATEEEITLAIESMVHIHVPKTGQLKGAGKEIIDTIFWTGQFYHAWQGKKERVPVHVIKKALGAKDDPGIRAILIQRFGVEFTHGLKDKGYHLWRAFATAIVWYDHLAFQARELK